MRYGGGGGGALTYFRKADETEREMNLVTSLNREVLNPRFINITLSATQPLVMKHKYYKGDRGVFFILSELST